MTSLTVKNNHIGPAGPPIYYLFVSFSDYGTWVNLIICESECTLARKCLRLSVSLSVSMSVSLSVSMSVCLSVSMSVCLSVCQVPCLCLNL